MFVEYDLVFAKQAYCFQTNKGRVSATQKGIDMAKNKWILFVRSNLTLAPDCIYQYLNSLELISPVALMGHIVYRSPDRIFTNYLNNIKRGINSYKHHSKIPFKFLLFGNCLIQAKAFQNIKLNNFLKYYGGEELDFSEKLNQSFPNKIMSCQLSIASRNNHPAFEQHCLRLIEFGKYNFNYLSQINKQHILGGSNLLKSLFLNLNLANITLSLCTKLYKWELPYINYYIIRLGLFAAILVGIKQTR